MFVLTCVIGSSCPGESWNVFFSPLNRIQQNHLIVMVDGRTRVTVWIFPFSSSGSSAKSFPCMQLSRVSRRSAHCILSVSVAALLGCLIVTRLKCTQDEIDLNTLTIRMNSEITVLQLSPGNMEIKPSRNLPRTIRVSSTVLAIAVKQNEQSFVNQLELYRTCTLIQNLHQSRYLLVTSYFSRYFCVCVLDISKPFPILETDIFKPVVYVQPTIEHFLIG
jgi:hypothetical protein